MILDDCGVVMTRSCRARGCSWGHDIANEVATGDIEATGSFIEEQDFGIAGQRC
jgi:hypothetical protein